MNIRSVISKIPLVRKVVISLLNFFEREIKIKHDITSRTFHLMLSAHRGYWFLGKKRENKEIYFLNRILKKHFSILEIGGHIGYLSNYFESKLEQNINDKTKLRFVEAEPTPKSIKFLRKNTYPNTLVLEKAFSDTVNQEIDFYTEDYGGFTNSIIREVTTESVNWNNRGDIEFLTLSKSQSNNQNQKINIIQVKTETVDNFCKENNFNPNFIKIDVEGAELQVLKGANNQLKVIDCMMVEVTHNKPEVLELLKENDFHLFSANFEKISSEPKNLYGNIFCLSSDYMKKEFLNGL